MVRINRKQRILLLNGQKIPEIWSKKITRKPFTIMQGLFWNSEPLLACGCTNFRYKDDHPQLGHLA